MKVKNTLQQQVWNYIRRNSSFRVGDILMLVPISKHALLEYLLVLKRAHYIRRHNRISTQIKTEDVEYVLIKKLGVHSPIIGQNRFKVYDPNTGDTYLLDKTRTEENSCAYYSKLLGKKSRFLDSYKQRRDYLKDATAKEVYEDFVFQVERSEAIMLKVKKIATYLSTKTLLNKFSEHLFEKGIFDGVGGFLQATYQMEKTRKVVLKNVSIERYEKSVEQFELLYGTLESLEETK